MAEKCSTGPGTLLPTVRYLRWGERQSALQYQTFDTHESFEETARSPQVRGCHSWYSAILHGSNKDTATLCYICRNATIIGIVHYLCC